MAGKSSKKAQADQKPKAFDEFEDDDEGFDEDVPDLEIKEPASRLCSRDWRDVEKHRELQELKKLMGDDDFDALFDSDLTDHVGKKSGNKKKKRK